MENYEQRQIAPKTKQEQDLNSNQQIQTIRKNRR